MSDTTKPEIIERDGWLIDAKNNRCSIEYWGSRDAAEKALLSNKDCSYCSDCSRCSYCSDCSYCSRCSDCSDCSDCSYCSYCSNCSRCSYCSGCSGCSNCSGKTDGDGGSVVEIPTINNIHQTIYAAASRPESLDMGSWHSCENTHCRAGWAVTLAGAAGKSLEQRFNTELAAMLIYRESGSPINPARFYDKNDAALADMKRLADEEAA